MNKEISHQTLKQFKITLVMQAKFVLIYCSCAFIIAAKEFYKFVQLRWEANKFRNTSVSFSDPI